MLHVLFLTLGVLVPACALLLVVKDDQSVALRILPEMSLPASCYSRSVLGIDCPACGLTRSIVYLVRGEFAPSLAVHRLGWLVFLAIIVQVPYRLWRLSRWGRVVVIGPREDLILWGGVMALLLLNRACDLVEWV